MKLKNIKKSLLPVFAIALLCACDESSTEIVDPVASETEKTTHIVARFDDDDAQVYIAPIDDMSEGTFTFDNNGYHLNPVRSARVFTDDLGWVYMFDYGGGYVKKYSYKSDSYTLVRELDIAPVMGGNSYVRPCKINEETILIHNANTSDIEDSGNGITKQADMYVTRVQIPEVVISEIMETWTIPVTTWDEADSAYVFRVDVPTVLDDKIYYGVGRKSFSADGTTTGMHTIVLDYPGLTNPEYIRSDKGNGNTNGYRGGNMHAIDGYVYQMNRAAEGDNSMMVRLKDGAYDDSWEWNLTESLGESFSTNNWYNAGDGICYMSAEMFDETDEDNNWTVLRVDVLNKKVIKMNVPLSYLSAYQGGVVEDGKFNMVIAPQGANVESPTIYSFDIDSEDPNAFEKGLVIDNSNIRVEGLF